MSGETAGSAGGLRVDTLDAIALHAQAARDPAALFRAVGEALRDQGLLCHLAERDATGDDFTICYASLPAPLARGAEALLGRPIAGMRLSARRIPSIARVIETGRAVYLDAPEGDIAAALPGAPRSVVKRLMRLVGAERVIVAPLLAGEEVRGILVALGGRLTAADAAAMERLGAHVGESLAATRALEAARRREGAALALGELSSRVAAGAATDELPALAVRALRGPLGAAAAAVWMLDETGGEGGREPDGVLRLVAQEGIPGPSLSGVAEIPLTANRLAARVVREGRTLALWGDEEAPDLRDTRQALAGGRFGLAITAPLRAGGALLGALSLTFAEARPATADERAFVDAVATQVAAALENARLLSETRAQARRSRLLADLAALLGGSLDRATVLDALVRRTAEILGGCAAVYLAHDEGDDLDVAAIHHPDPAILARIEQGLRASPPRAGVGVFGLAYARAHPLLVRFDDPSLPAESRVYAGELGATSSVGVPLLLRGRRVGVLSVTSFDRERPYTTDDLALASAIAALATQALDNARAYAAAEGERRRLAATFASMAEAVYLFDAAGRLVDLNEAALRQLGVASRADVTNEAATMLGLRTLSQPDGRPLSPDETAVRRAIRGESDIVGVEQVGRSAATGEERRLVVNAAPLYDAAGAPAGAVVVAHDVTALRAAERAKDEFLNVASHELRTPLTPLKGFAQLLDAALARAEGGAPPDYARLRRYVRTMEGRVDHLSELVGEMLEFAHLQTGHLTLRFEDVDLVVIARRVVDVAAAQWAGDGDAQRYLTLDAPAPVVAHCDASRIRQALAALIANAVKYTAEGGHVWVSVGRDGDEAVVRVDDDGMGIPTGEEDAVFGAFAQASNAPAAYYGGLGLGLFICREIVARHGGSVSAVPRDPSGARPGASVRMRLPRARQVHGRPSE